MAWSFICRPSALRFSVDRLNFNHERWMIIVAIVRACRAVTEECMKWAQQREVFGKPLVEQPVIRAHLASMVAQTEACHAWLERITPVGTSRRAERSFMESPS